MKKKNWMILFLFFALLVGIGVFFYYKNSAPAPSTDENNYEANRTSTDNTNNALEEEKTKEDPASSPTEVKQGITEPTPPVEEQIATFTTKIYSSDGARQNNISITCNTLNGTIVKNGATFSFCNTVGQASTNKGYQKADIFDKDGNKKKGLGGRKLSN